MKVVLLDDNKLFNFVSAHTIQAAEFSDNINEFVSGEKALKFLRSLVNKREELPDIIFLDVKMQNMDGFGFLAEFSKLPDQIKSKVKICMLSSSLLATDKERAMKYNNVIEFLNKPLTIEKLNHIKSKIALTSKF